MEEALVSRKKTEADKTLNIKIIFECSNICYMTLNRIYYYFSSELLTLLFSNI